MGLLDKFKTSIAIDRLSEEKLYEQVAQELKAGKKREGIWVKAMAKSGGDLNKAESMYIELRVQSLRDEHIVEKEVVNTANSSARRQDELARQAEQSKESELVRRAEVCIGELKDRGYKTVWSETLNSFVVIDKRPNKKLSFKTVDLLCTFSNSAPISDTKEYRESLFSKIMLSVLVVTLLLWAIDYSIK